MKKIRRLAATTEQSINKTTIALLKKGLGLENKTSKKRDLSGLAGKWSKKDAVEFRKHIRIFESIDKEVWQ
jgi:hypothetical protein